MARSTASRVLLAAFACAVAIASRGATLADDASDVSSCLSTIRSSDDPVARFAAVRRLGAIDEPGVPGKLAELVRGDRDPGIRLEAAHACAKSPVGSTDRAVVELLAEGGPREIREALARVLRDRGVPVAAVVRELERPTRDPAERCRIAESLSVYDDPLAAGHLERLARTWRGPTRDATLRALERHRLGPSVLPDVVADLLATADDTDSVVGLLDVAERYGDDRVEALRDRLASLGNPAVDAAFECATAHIAERRALRGGGAPVRPARVRDRVDRVHVAHQGRDLARVWQAVRADLRGANPRWEDRRVACVLYLEPSSTRPSRSEVRLELTRDLAKVDSFFTDLVYQTKRGSGVGMTEAIESAFNRTSWRWDAQRTVILYADAAPRGVERAATSPAVHRAMDGTALQVLYFARDPADVPKAVERVAEAGGTTVQTVDPENSSSGTPMTSGTPDSAVPGPGSPLPPGVGPDSGDRKGKR